MGYTYRDYKIPTSQGTQFLFLWWRRGLLCNNIYVRIFMKMLQILSISDRGGYKMIELFYPILINYGLPHRHSACWGLVHPDWEPCPTTVLSPTQNFNNFIHLYYIMYALWLLQLHISVLYYVCHLTATTSYIYIALRMPFDCYNIKNKTFIREWPFNTTGMEGVIGRGDFLISFFHKEKMLSNACDNFFRILKIIMWHETLKYFSHYTVRALCMEPRHCPQ